MTCNSNIINFIVYPSPLPKKSTIVISSSSSQVNGYWSDLLYMCRAARIRNCWLEKMSVHVQHLVFHYVNNYLDSVKKKSFIDYQHLTDDWTVCNTFQSVVNFQENVRHEIVGNKITCQFSKLRAYPVSTERGGIVL